MEHQLTLESLPDVLTVAQVAEYLQMSTKFVRGLIRDGCIATNRMGRAVRIQKDAIREYLAKTAA